MRQERWGPNLRGLQDVPHSADVVQENARSEDNFLLQEAPARPDGIRAGIRLGTCQRVGQRDPNEWKYGVAEHLPVGRRYRKVEKYIFKPRKLLNLML